MKQLLLGLVIALSFSASAQYCLPTYNSQCTSGDFIDIFQFNTINNGPTGCTSPSANNYQDYTASISTTVAQGQSYSVTCTPGASWGQYFAVFVDFDQNGDFDGANEYFDIGYAAAGSSVTNTITIPLAILSGSTTLRVVCSYGTTPIVAGQACSNFSWGETEDYELIVIPPPADDAASQSLDAPTNGCGMGIENVMATFLNSGTNAITTMDVCYRVNGGAWICDNLTGLNIASFATYQHTFTTPVDLSTPGTYVFDIAVSLAGDGNTTNDTLWNVSIESIPLIAGLPYQEDFEAGGGGWVPSGSGANWEHGIAGETNIFGNGGCLPGHVNVWATGLTTPYANSALEYLTSPCLDFSSVGSDPTITFDQMVRTEDCCDELWLEVSTDGGANWAVVGTNTSGYNWYNNGFNNWFSGATSTNPGEWQKSGHVLTGTAGQSSVILRFVFSSDGSVIDEGVAIDNINIGGGIGLSDGRAVSMSSPISNCSLSNSETVIATFDNAGADTLVGFDVCYIINGGAPVCETLSNTLAPGATYTHTFATPADLSAIGTYNIQIAIGAPSPDSCATYSNDTILTVVEHKPTIMTYPYVQDFESGTGGWSADNSMNGSWELATPAATVINSAYSGVNSWVTNATGLYNGSENSFVYGPCFDFTTLTNNAWVGMQVWWESEFSWDGANLQTSLDGVTWSNVGDYGDPFNWYNDNTLNGNPGGSQIGWTGNIGGGSGSGGWVHAKHALDSSLLGQSGVQFRVAFGSDASVNQEGFAFDNFTISEAPQLELGPDLVLCGDMSFTYGMPGTYEWYTEDILTGQSTLFSTSSSVVFPNNGDETYNVILVFTDTIGICVSDTLQLDFDAAPSPPTISGSMDTICTYQNLTLDGGAGYDTWSWSTGGSQQTEFVAGISLPLGANTIVLSVTDGSACTSEDTVTIFVSDCAGIDELGWEIELFPNPSSGIFEYSLSEDLEIIGLTITDMNGKLIDELKTEHQGTIDLRNLGSGTYFLNVRIPQAESSIRMVKM